MWKRMIFACLVACLAPYAVTLAWTGTLGLDGAWGGAGPQDAAQRFVVMDENGGSAGPEAMDLEAYLVGVVAGQIPPDYGPEAMKAQAIMERTYLYKKMDGRTRIAESQLETEYKSPDQLKELWGSGRFVEAYADLEDAVQSTAGQVLTYEGGYIDPLFHRVSACMTRNGGPSHPYLESVPCPEDVEAEGYMQICIWTPEELAGLLAPCLEGREETDGAQQGAVAPDQIAVAATDAAGYVREVTLTVDRGEGQEPTAVSLDGEAVAEALGLHSSNYTLESYEGRIRAVCLGSGHGYGLCQHGAGRMAAKGSNAEEILTRYYKNIVLTTE